MDTEYFQGGYIPTRIGGNIRRIGDPASRTVTTYDESGAVVSTRPYTPEENADADARAADAQAESVAAQLETDATADLTNLRAAIDQLALLLADNTTTGSIRAWKAPIANNATLTGAQGKALADLLIDDTQATRKIARQVLRLAKAMVGDYASADVGTE